MFGLTGLATAAPHSAAATHAAPAVHASAPAVKSTAIAAHGFTPAGTVTAKTAPSGDNGTTIDPLLYNCGNNHTSCGHVGESFGYYNSASVDLLYTENYYCDANVTSAAATGCEVGQSYSGHSNGPSGTPSASSSGGSGTSLGNTTHGDTLYIPVPLFANPPATECSATATCIDHPPTVDLSRIASALPGSPSPSSLDNVAIPAHNHVVATRNSGNPEWWNVVVVATTSPSTFASLTSLSAINAALTASTAIEAQSNIFLFFQVMPGTVPTDIATSPTYLNADLYPPLPGFGPAPGPGAGDQSEAGATFNNLFNDCGKSAPNCENVGIAHGWVGGTPGVAGQDTQLLYTEQYYCSGPSGASSGCEAGAPAANVPPGVSDPLVPTAANSAPGATGNGQIDPLYIPVPLGFTPTYAQCSGAITCIDHPATIDLSRIAAYLPGSPAPSSLTNVPLPSHDHVLRTRNADQPEWWNVEVVPVTSQAQLTAIEDFKNLSSAQEHAFDPTSNPGGAIDTNVFLWFQTLPGGAVATPGPVQTTCQATLPAGEVVAAAALPDGTGYVETDRSGDVAVFGAATCYGSLTGTKLNRPIVGITVDRQTGGYWLVASDGGVFSFYAPFMGSTGALTLNAPVVGMATDLLGQGYWLVASDGGVFSFGEPFFGSAGDLTLNKPVVGIAYDRGTGGYMLVASDGGVFNYNSTYYGSTGGLTLNKPVVAIAPLSDGSGYREIAADGGVFSFPATTPFYGSAGNLQLNQPIVAGANDNSTDGYWAFAADGGVFSFGTAFYGSAA